METIILAVVTVLTTVVISGVSSLQCYQCYVNPPRGQTYNTTPLCSHFDYSKRFIVDCPDSTMCTKKETKLVIQDGVTVTDIERDCAIQRYEDEVLTKAGWKPRVEIKEPYPEDCEIPDDRGEKITTTKICYCRGDLCNTSNSNHEGYTDIMGFIVVFNLMKYINSLR